MWYHINVKVGDTMFDKKKLKENILLIAGLVVIVIILAFINTFVPSV